MTRKIDTILFDLDGTLINTIDLIIASFEHTLKVYFPERDYSRDEVVSFIGPPLSETFGRLNPGQVEEMIQEYRRFNHTNHDDLVTEYAGVIETLESLKKEGYKMGIVTSKRRDTALRGIELMNLGSFFPVIVSLDEVTKYKPDAQPVERALEGLGSEADQAVMVGDSEHDILSGKNAGTWTAGVSWSVHGKAHLESFSPDVMLESMTDLLDYLKTRT
ncbi:pyrophosphatase PpaX [Salisediminibacterium selenitireducens]|uniref:Pyrophosphatase PpaX n=1 Tax=Bacillus selenitireducens (strain ATCC 700615 / DSM 15326 / MLS10) TaxID=439292 RepID=D6Y107_BACIE|nr:pyrophosphatase PpaX [Salisediminibacterium selenitireducens]ADH98611.1 HAD-superfamily hydrolase, subfamily IA, variant 1 [[Bacillus] selenitireducens MLS10]